MKNRLLIAAFVSICFLSGSCKISSGQGSRYDFSSLDSVIQGWVDKGYYPGASICVVKNDTVIFQKNYRDYTPDTKVYVASAGKWVAAAVIGVVVDRTDLGWDDPVEKWLPEFKDDAKGKILLRQLLSHTSGVRPYLPEPRVDNYNPQIQISAESETKRSIFREKDKTKRSKKESAQHSKSRNKSFVMTSVSAL